MSALASDVELLLLDEPTAGLDPLMEAVFQDCIRDATAEGVTVLLSSHILAQVEVLADSISIIRQGRIVEMGTLSELRHLTRTTVTVEHVHDPDPLAELPGVHDLRHEAGRLHFEVDGEHMDAVVQALATLGAPKVLVVDSSDNQNLRLSTRNLAQASFLDIRGLNVYDILRFPKLLISEASLRQVEARLSGVKSDAVKEVA